MKKRLLLGLFMVLITGLLSSVTATSIKPPSLNERLITEFLAMTPKKYTEISGKKMSLPEKISLKLAQRKVRNMLRKGKEVDLLSVKKRMDTSNFSIIGFLLGLILSLIGVLFAYLTHDDTVIRWAWIGAGVGAIIILISLLV